MLGLELGQSEDSSRRPNYLKWSRTFVNHGFHMVSNRTNNNIVTIGDPYDSKTILQPA